MVRRLLVLNLMLNAFFAFLILICFSTAWGQGLSREEVIAKRISGISLSHLGKPYIKEGPLGEGFGYDADPLYRFDGFDCTTFVETVIAQALSPNHQVFVENMNYIRYKNGEVDFLKRNHFTSVDWIPNNQKNGLLRDITRELFPQEYKTSETWIDKASWFKKNHAMTVNMKPELSRLDYLPIVAVLRNPDILNRIPDGAIINIVRPNWRIKDKIGTDLDISHQGFAIRDKEGNLFFRHASQEQLRVTQETLYSYLKRMSSNKTIGGVSILKIN